MKSGLIDITAVVRHETEGAYLLFDGRFDEMNQEKRVWVPKSKVEDNGDGTFTMPEWLAYEKEMI